MEIDYPIPTGAQEFEALLPLGPENRLSFCQKDVRQEYKWINQIDPEGDRVNVLSCHEIKNNQQPKEFGWLTNLKVTSRNCFIIANEGGRKRCLSAITDCPYSDSAFGIWTFGQKENQKALRKR